MSELISIPGKAVVDSRVMIRLLSMLEPAALDHNSTTYHIGYERAKADLLSVLGEGLGPEFKKSAATRLIQELRRDRRA